MYQPKLQTPKAVRRAVSSQSMKCITDRFLADIRHYADRNELPMIAFEKGQREEDIAAQYLQESDGREFEFLARGWQGFAGAVCQEFMPRRRQDANPPGFKIILPN